MNASILLITGWGGGTQLLEPLQHKLQQQGHHVELINIFNALDADILQHHVELAHRFDVIMGWSLGGQLATLLTQQLQQQYQEQKTLITLASNPCFVAQSNWSTAMPQETFEQFKLSFQQDAITTLKRFGFLVCQGADSAKKDFIQMQKLIKPQPISLLQHGLVLLEQLNLTETLAHYTGQQLHVFAQHDALVPGEIIQNMPQLLAENVKVVCIEHASHGFPCFEVEQSVQIIEDFINTTFQAV
ncbi:hydrolase [Acinetobacter sp. ANC 4910]|uniref:hydrolase n=1 Tax=Acinetobacter sp. ANC 4910 TaxID=2529850 RepID=UPI001040DC44|nr:hydrolase [Acinetobacter sp. ANC 4910]TCB38281.1 hydrolase [Acinetobacter sp. ANC 4910]